MADNMIEIGFTVDQDDLTAGLDQAQDDLAKFQKEIADQWVRAKRLSGELLTFQDFAGSSDANAKRKIDQDSFAAQAANIQELRSLNQISADDEIRQQQAIEDAKFKQLSDDIQQEYSASAQKLADQKRYQAELDQLELQHYAKLRQLDQKAISESMQAWQQMLTPISNAFSSSLTGMITGQQSFRQSLANIGNAIVSDFVNMAVKRATNWIASELTMTQASAAGDAARLATHASADAAGKAAQAASGSATVFGDANKAASGAFSAVAGIPYVGPILAPVAAATAFAAVMAFDVFSARGGFDIPAGLNPVTQLHEREMVLPASIADPLRAGLAGGGRPAGGDIHIHAVDAASFQRLLMDNKSALARALRGAHRSFDPALA